MNPTDKNPLEKIRWLHLSVGLKNIKILFPTDR